MDTGNDRLYPRSTLQLGVLESGLRAALDFFPLLPSCTYPDMVIVLSKWRWEGYDRK